MLFYMKRNIQISGTTLIQTAYEAIERRLPPGWQLARDGESPIPADAVFNLRAPGAAEGQIAVEAKDSLDPRTVDAVVRQLQSFGLPATLVVAPYIGPEARARLIAADCGYADSTGNLRFVSTHPAVFIEASGLSKNPWREEHPLTSLKGRAAGDVVRALCDFRPPYGVRELVKRGGLALGTVSRVLDLLTRDATLVRGERGAVLDVDWEATIRRWARDYICLEANRPWQYFDARGLATLPARLRDCGELYAITGSLAAVTRAPIAPARLALIYADDVDALARRVGLKKVDTGANVILLEPRSSVVFERMWEAEDVEYAALTQVAADLLSAPGRGPAEAEALLNWMREHEDVWRT
ncbi:MAG: hypothetical protein JWM80_844 [Cyanobacteria bacterium RYN_339]|nr:hypothetical protein [Cyanobacteria bacterium RYN_339]